MPSSLIDGIDLFLFTYNCAKASPPSDVLVPRLGFVLPDIPPHLVVFGFEEICPIMDASFATSTLPFTSHLDNIIEKSLEDKYTNGDVEALYTKVGSRSVGAIYISIYTSIPNSVIKSSVLKGSTSTGYFFSSLKGAVGIRFKLKLSEDEQTEFTFVDAHLAANEGLTNRIKRNHDFLSIAKYLDFGDGYGLYKPGSHLFFMGDLNYRAQVTEVPDHSNDAASTSLNPGFVETQRISFDTESVPLLKNSATTVDELSLVIQQNDAFFGFDEAKISFNPTYKFVLGKPGIYTTKRTPSWCDRILFKQYLTDPAIVHTYDSIKGIDTSDHQPVYLNITVPFNAPSQSLVSETGELLHPTNRDIGKVILKPKYVYLFKAISATADRVIGTALYLLFSNAGRISGVSITILFVLLACLVPKVVRAPIDPVIAIDELI